MGPTRNVAWKTPFRAMGQSQPIVWGSRVFLTADVEGGPAPADHKAPVHMMEGQPWVHPDSVGIDKLHTMKVLALDLATGAVLWERTAYEGTVFDHRHRRGSYAAPTMVTDGAMVVAYFGPEGLYGYDFDGNLEVEGRRRQVPAARDGDRHLAGAVREPGDHPARRERGQAVAAAGLRHQDRQGSVADAADGGGQLVHAGPRDADGRPSW